MTYLMENGFITVNPKKTPLPPLTKRSPPVVNDSPDDSNFTEVTEESYSFLLLKAMNLGAAGKEIPRELLTLLDKVRDYLNIKGKITKDVPPEITPPRGDTADIAD